MGSSRPGLGLPGIARNERNLRLWLLSAGLGILLFILLLGNWPKISATHHNSQSLFGQDEKLARRHKQSLKSGIANFIEIKQTFYGIDSVPTEDLSTVSSLGAQIIGQVFPHDGTPETWLFNLDQAQKYNLTVIAWLYPQGWEWGGKEWIIDSQAQLFIKTVANHPSLFAIYALHEPYWSGCWGCGYSTYQQQLLYRQIKKIAGVPIFSAVDSMSFWTRQGDETAFAAGICDYCATWYYPFTVNGYKRNELIRRLRSDLKTARQRAPNSKIIWLMQVFVHEESGLRMPSSNEMYDLASIVYESGCDGAIWYVWKFNSLYDDYLSNHTELFDVVKKVYLDFIAPE